MKSKKLMKRQDSKVITLICFRSLRDSDRNLMKKSIHVKEMLKLDGHTLKRKEMDLLDQLCRAATKKFSLLKKDKLFQNN